jgi:hypothetical protein
MLCQTSFGGLVLVPLGGALALLPRLGMMLNGTSSVLYGSVPDFTAEGARPRASSADAEETGDRSGGGDDPVMLIKQQRVNRADGLVFGMFTRSPSSRRKDHQAPHRARNVA